MNTIRCTRRISSTSKALLGASEVAPSTNRVLQPVSCMFCLKWTLCILYNVVFATITESCSKESTFFSQIIRNGWKIQFLSLRNNFPLIYLLWTRDSHDEYLNSLLFFSLLLAMRCTSGKFCKMSLEIGILDASLTLFLICSSWAVISIVEWLALSSSNVLFWISGNERKNNEDVGSFLIQVSRVTAPRILQLFSRIPSYLEMTCSSKETLCEVEGFLWIRLTHEGVASFAYIISVSH